MKKTICMLSMVAVVGLAACTTFAATPGAPPTGTPMDSFGGRDGAPRGRVGGRGNSGDTAPSDNPSARSLSNPTTPTAQPNANGFIQRWLVLEPIAAQGVGQNAFQAAAKKEYFPNQLTAIPKDGDKVTVNGAELTWHAKDTKNYNLNLVHFANELRVSSANVMFWVVAIVNCPEEMKDVRLAIGSNDASIWWVNGQEVIGIYGDRQTIIDDGVSKRITLKKGPNVIRAAVHNQQGQTDFCARILDEAGNTVKNFTVSLSEDGK
jgi:hypothetical protein